jgi:N-methylhydantoinase B
MKGKGKQAVPPERRVKMAFPGGAGFGPAADRDRAAVLRDLALGYISAYAAETVYRLDRATIDRVLAAARLGDLAE